MDGLLPMTRSVSIIAGISAAAGSLHIRSRKAADEIPRNPPPKVMALPHRPSPSCKPEHTDKLLLRGTAEGDDRWQLSAKETDAVPFASMKRYGSNAVHFCCPNDGGLHGKMFHKVPQKVEDLLAVRQSGIHPTVAFPAFLCYVDDTLQGYGTKG